MLSELTNLATEKKSAIETSFEQTDELTANQNQLRILSEKLINDQSEIRIIEDEISNLQSELKRKTEMEEAFEELNREKDRLQGELEALKNHEVEKNEEVKTSKDHLETLLKRIQEFQVYLETRQNTHVSTIIFFFENWNIKWSASFQWSFGPNSAWRRPFRHRRTIRKTHPTLHFVMMTSLLRNLETKFLF